MNAITCLVEVLQDINLTSNMSLVSYAFGCLMFTLLSWERAVCCPIELFSLNVPISMHQHHIYCKTPMHKVCPVATTIGRVCDRLWRSRQLSIIWRRPFSLRCNSVPGCNEVIRLNWKFNSSTIKPRRVLNLAFAFRSRICALPLLRMK
jgi:hypothetical protein